MSNAEPSSVEPVASKDRWQFWIDRGGTFTDIVARRPDGQMVTYKLLSENPEHYADAVIAGMRQLLAQNGAQTLSPEHVSVVRLGTTVATNALLERKGEPTLLAITRGFGDALRIGYQNRPRLFDLQIVLPQPLYTHVVEIDERLGARGELVRSLDLAQARAGLEHAYQQGLRAIAIVLMHGYRHPQHEAALAQLARQIGFTQVSVSHQVSPLMKLVARGDTTVADAYLSPILRRYVERVQQAMPGVRLQCMQSNGGLTDADRFAGKDALLSGPAGGIIGMVRVSKQAGFDHVIGFDMGGTSTDVSHFAGEFERVFDTQVAGVRIRAPMMDIHTVAAGGGSVLTFDGNRLRVGPDSAGAHPGPASYRRGGPLTVTDCNVLLGRVQPAWFPHVFGRDANEALDADAVSAQFSALAETVATATGARKSPEELAEGCIEIAVTLMAQAIKQISVQRGHDVTRYVLTAFGGAGGQHACRVADALDMRTVFIHSLAGVLSAYGMGLAEQTVMREQAMEVPLDASTLPTLQMAVDTLGQATLAELMVQGVSSDGVRVVTRVHLRYAGTDTPLILPFGTLAAMRLAFEAAYRERYAFLMPDKTIMVEAISAEAMTCSPLLDEAPPAPPSRLGELRAHTHVRIFDHGQWQLAPLYQRADLRPGDVVTGLAIIAESYATTVVDQGWQAEVTAHNHLILQRLTRLIRHQAGEDRVDPVMLELFNHRFMSVAEQMGLRLQNTAHSVNIKERLDFSCAVFDADGQLVANAPHIPVHLGSMGESVETVIRRNVGTIQPGDVFAINDPYQGGTHLPDITVITPVFDATNQAILFYVGSRGHHADIGGRTPGSIPPDSTSVDEEGVLFDNWKLVAEGSLRDAETRTHLAAGRYPARNIEQNMADLRAQIAANQKGVDELRQMAAQFGLTVVQGYMGHVQRNAEQAIRRVVATLDDGDFTLPLDNGAVIRVAIRVDRAARAATIDFTGTSAQQPNNFNAPRAVCMAAVLYVFRTLVADDIPLNAGCLRPLTIVIPEGSMLNPRYPAAVVAGNVETSSCIVNALYGALGALAANAGTMNNFTFGNASTQYYETIASGSGAGPGFDGADVVQTAMTNSRLTDPEVLEWRFPVRLESFAIRPDSDGRGRWHGGKGGVRKIRFLQSMTAAIVSNNRVHPPFGLAGGEAGALGRNTVVRADGRVETLAHIAQTPVEIGDMIVIETPGGGGYGRIDGDTAPATGDGQASSTQTKPC